MTNGNDNLDKWVKKAKESFNEGSDQTAEKVDRWLKKAKDKLDHGLDKVGNWFEGAEEGVKGVFCDPCEKEDNSIILEKLSTIEKFLVDGNIEGAKEEVSKAKSFLGEVSALDDSEL